MVIGTWIARGQCSTLPLAKPTGTMGSDAVIVVGIDGNIIPAAAEAAGFKRDDVTSWNEIERVRSAFTFARHCAIMADIPKAESWRLIYDSTRVWNWHIIDSETYEADSFFLDNVAITIQSSDSRAVRNELEAYGKALRGVWELAKHGKCIDLMSERARKSVS